MPIAVILIEQSTDQLSCSAELDIGIIAANAACGRSVYRYLRSGCASEWDSKGERQTPSGSGNLSSQLSLTLTNNTLSTANRANNDIEIASPNIPKTSDGVACNDEDKAEVSDLGSNLPITSSSTDRRSSPENTRMDGSPTACRTCSSSQGSNLSGESDLSGKSNISRYSNLSQELRLSRTQTLENSDPRELRLSGTQPYETEIKRS
jgi:hypothetical protein